MADYRISELAERTGFTASALRYYEQVGLVPTHRSKNGYRTYDDEQLARLQFIARAKRLGLSLDDIRDLVRVWEDGSCSTVQARLGELIAARSRDVASRIDELTTFDAELLRARAMLSSRTPDGPCDDTCRCNAATADQPAAPEPVACTLSTDDRTARGVEWTSVLERASSRVAVAGGFDITFQATADLAARIADLAVREQECCSFFRFALHIAGGGRVTLRIRAPHDADLMLRALFGRDDPVAAAAC